MAVTEKEEREQPIASVNSFRLLRMQAVVKKKRQYLTSSNKRLNGENKNKVW